MLLERSGVHHQAIRRHSPKERRIHTHTHTHTHSEVTQWPVSSPWKNREYGHMWLEFTPKTCRTQTGAANTEQRMSK